MARLMSLIRPNLISPRTKISWNPDHQTVITLTIHPHQQSTQQYPQTVNIVEQCKL